MRNHLAAPAPAATTARSTVTPRRPLSRGLPRWSMAVLALAGLLHLNLALAALGADDLFDWAERTYPAHFPGPQPTTLVPPYTLRHYPATGNYVGVSDGMVYVYGPLSQYQLQAVGPLSAFECQVLPASCGSVSLPRLQVQQGLGTARSQDGRLIAWGVRPPHLATDGAPIAGADGNARVLSDSGRQLIASIWGGLLLTSTGQVQSWGDAFWSNGGPRFAARQVIDLPGEAVDMAVNAGYFTAHVLLRDGSALEIPGVSVVEGGVRKRQPRRLAFPQPVIALHRGDPAIPYFVLRDGSVWRQPTRNEAGPVVVSGASAIVEVHCGTWLCVGVSASGSAVVWGAAGNVLGTAPDQARPLNFPRPIKQATADGRTVAVLSTDGLMWFLPMEDNVGYKIESIPGLANVTDIACGGVCLARRADGTVWTVSGSSTQGVRQVRGLVVP